MTDNSNPFGNIPPHIAAIALDCARTIMDKEKTMSHTMITDMSLLLESLKGNQEGLDALKRLVEYLNALEVQFDIQDELIQDISWEGDVGIIEQSAVDALNGDLIEAMTNVPHNYAGLVEAEKAVANVSAVDIDLTPTTYVEEAIKRDPLQVYNYSGDDGTLGGSGGGW